MPNGYRMSSGNNRRLVAAGKGFRGGPTTESDLSHLAGVATADGLEGDTQGSAWCGHNWSSWQTLSENPLARGVGLYRIRGKADDGLAYVGEGKISSRLAAYLRKANMAETGRTVQGAVFAQFETLEFAYVQGGWETHQRLELETDLIAAHVLRLGRSPAAQFLA
jgi:hypothetical protein